MENSTAERRVICPNCSAENLSWRSRCERCGEELHKNERGLPKFESRGVVFWIAFIAGLVGTLLIFLIALLTAGYFMLFFPVLGLVLCWKWPKIAGVALIVGGLLPTILIFTQGGSGDMLGYLLWLLGIIIPLVASGVIFLALGRD